MNPPRQLVCGGQVEELPVDADLPVSHDAQRPRAERSKCSLDERIELRLVLTRIGESAEPGSTNDALLGRDFRSCVSQASIPGDRAGDEKRRQRCCARADAQGHEQNTARPTGQAPTCQRHDIQNLSDSRRHEPGMLVP
jgi:hypothetical protein